MARIETGRIIYGVQYKLNSDYMQCVASWFTEYSEAKQYFNKLVSISDDDCDPDYRVYRELRIVSLRLPDGFEDCETTPVIRAY